MKAILVREFGGPDVLKIEVPTPKPAVPAGYLCPDLVDIPWDECLPG